MLQFSCPNYLPNWRVLLIFDFDAWYDVFNEANRAKYEFEREDIGKLSGAARARSGLLRGRRGFSSTTKSSAWEQRPWRWKRIRSNPRCSKERIRRTPTPTTKYWTLSGRATFRVQKRWRSQRRRDRRDLLIRTIRDRHKREAPLGHRHL